MNTAEQTVISREWDRLIMPCAICREPLDLVLRDPLMSVARALEAMEAEALRCGWKVLFEGDHESGSTGWICRDCMKREF